jgi:hypothetical protein
MPCRSDPDFYLKALRPNPYPDQANDADCVSIRIRIRNTISNKLEFHGAKTNHSIWIQMNLCRYGSATSPTQNPIDNSIQ